MSQEMQVIVHMLEIQNTLIVGGFTLVFVLMGFMWNSLRGDIREGDDRLSSDIRLGDDRLSSGIEGIDEKLTDVDRRLCRLEGSFSSKEFCAPRHNQDRKAE
jgi:hypothetical protein